LGSAQLRLLQGEKIRLDAGEDSSHPQMQRASDASAAVWGDLILPELHGGTAERSDERGRRSDLVADREPLNPHDLSRRANPRKQASRT
jgi:hypothetical protein